MSGPTSPGIVHHIATRAVCDILHVLAAFPGWISTHEAGARADLNRNSARRTLRELAAHDWVARRQDAEGTETWRLGPQLVDLAQAYRQIVGARGAEVDDDLRLLDHPLDEGRLVLPSRASVAFALPKPPTSTSHQGTALVCQVIHAVVMGRGASTAARLVTLTEAHPHTVAAVVAELAEHGWLRREWFERTEIWHLGPGLARLVHQHAPFRLGIR